MDPPSSKLSVFARRGPSRLVSTPPTRRLMQLFAASATNADPAVAATAEQSAGVIQYAGRNLPSGWPTW